MYNDELKKEINTLISHINRILESVNEGKTVENINIKIFTIKKSLGEIYSLCNQLNLSFNINLIQFEVVDDKNKLEDYLIDVEKELHTILSIL